MTRLLSIFVVLFFLFSRSPVYAATHDVSFTGSGFTPQSVTITVGDTIRWTNSSTDYVELASDPHPTHTNYPALNLGIVNPGNTTTLSFSTAGSYGYHNHLNSSHIGTVIVQAATASPSPTSTPQPSASSTPLASTPTAVNPSPATTVIPVTGSAFPTFLLVSLSLGLVIFGVSRHKFQK